MKPRFPPTTPLMPAHFVEPIGYVMIAHADLDETLRNAIILLSGMDPNAGCAVLSGMMIRARVDIFQKLVRTKAQSIDDLAKMLTIGDVINQVSDERNTLAHRLLYSWSPETNEIVYFRDVNLTNPQIRISRPYVASVDSICDLSWRIARAAAWLGMLQQRWLPNDAKMPIDDSTARRHPDWEQNDRLPWQAEFLKKLESERKSLRTCTY
ncbi:hypothetical protein A8950_1129 [Dongia mobilis]|uniref:Uncharacterized protein n=1 Tax=Dongia mobilis TaxID=578943 RepID=A0A4R6WWI8_9PROT|nr:hypothetical protein A8950_1129 [Dongia mobilis]